MFVWDAQARKYKDSDTGAHLSDDDLRSIMDEFVLSLIVLFAGRARRVIDALVNIEQNEQEFRNALTDWQIETRQDIGAAHLAAAVVAFGGFNVVNAEQMQTGEDAAAFHLNFWDAFVGGVFTGAVLLDNNFPPRSGLYGSGVYSTFENAVRMREINAGEYTEERRYTTAAESCAECLEFEARKWQPINSLPAVGRLCSCRSNCRCFFRYR